MDKMYKLFLTASDNGVALLVCDSDDFKGIPGKKIGKTNNTNSIV